MEKNKKKYRELCEREETIPIFSRDWWLDAVCGDSSWDVAVVKNEERILGTMPYVYSKDKSELVMPLLTQTLGPWLAKSFATYTNQLGEQKKIFQGLMEQLPQCMNFFQNFHYNITNWQPFYWAGYTQTTNYTYILDDIADTKKLWSASSHNIRTDINKAQNRYNIVIKSDANSNFTFDDFFKVSILTFARQHMPAPYPREFVENVYMACKARGVGRLFFAVDPDEHIHAVLFLIWDENSAYYLMGGGDPSLRNSGATSLLLWEAIQYAASVTKKFDFEGSMLEPVEKFFRAFGAKQTPYFQITKTDPRREYMKNLRKTLSPIKHPIKFIKLWF